MVSNPKFPEGPKVDGDYYSNTAYNVGPYINSLVMSGYNTPRWSAQLYAELNSNGVARISGQAGSYVHGLCSTDVRYSITLWWFGFKLLKPTTR